MQTTRRTFLRVLGSAAVEATVLAPPTVESLLVEAPALPVTILQFLRAAHDLALERGELDAARLVAHISQTLARETGLVYVVELAAS